MYTLNQTNAARDRRDKAQQRAIALMQQEQKEREAKKAAEANKAK
jgi:hypothetical protein